jgi:hypothetical protein
MPVFHAGNDFHCARTLMISPAGVFCPPQLQFMRLFPLVTPFGTTALSWYSPGLIKPANVNLALMPPGHPLRLLHSFQEAR